MRLRAAQKTARAPESPWSPNAPGPAAPPAAPELAGAALHAARKEQARIEGRLDRIAGLEASLHERMAAAHADHVALLELTAQLAALASERDDLETRWLEVSERLPG